jgi:hypothetical protein
MSTTPAAHDSVSLSSPEPIVHPGPDEYKEIDDIAIDAVSNHQHGEFVANASGKDDAIYGVGGVGRTQRRLKARHVTFIGFGGGIGTGLFIGTGAALSRVRHCRKLDRRVSFWRSPLSVLSCGV